MIVYVWLALVIVFVVIMRYTQFGVLTYSTGGGEKSSKLNGVNTNRIKLLAYVICGVLCGIAAILYIGRLALAEPGAGETFGMDSITAVVIGGAFLTGGVGKLSNAFLGVLILGMLNNFMNIVGIPSAMHVGIRGFLLVVTVYLYKTNVFDRLSVRQRSLRTSTS